MAPIKKAVEKYRSDGVKQLLRSIPKYLKRRFLRNVPHQYRVKEREQIHNYWKSRSDESVSNRIHTNIDIPRRQFLLALLEPEVRNDEKILELGCQVGGTLNYLYENGYANLAGIEINSEALNVLRREFPELASNAELYGSSIEDKITDFEPDEVDTCFTMAVLEHIHPESEWIFEEMARITSKCIITIEDESAVSSRHIPRDYSEIFTNFGFELVKSVQYDDMPSDVEYASGFIARVFRVA